MTVPPKRTPAGDLWTCDACGTTSLWTDEHQWYGSYADLEGLVRRRPTGDGPRWDLIVITCCDGCREIAVVSGLVPDDAELLAS